MRTPSTATFILITLAPGIGADPQSGTPAASACIDSIKATASINPKLDDRLFYQTKASLNWWMVESDSGSLEDTGDGEIEPDDLVRIEHTARCTSTHQGDHLMEFCDAFRVGEGVRLHLTGGMPACASSLEVSIGPDLSFKCGFEASYPASTARLHWNITKKELRLKSRDFSPGQRLFAWISVTFEESTEGAKPKTHTIEGALKPVICHPPKTK